LIVSTKARSAEGTWRSRREEWCRRALYLARAGHLVIATGRDLAALRSLHADAAGSPRHTVALDMNDRASITHALEEVARLTDGYGLHALVNDAGYGEISPSAPPWIPSRCPDRVETESTARSSRTHLVSATRTCEGRRTRHAKEGDVLAYARMRTLEHSNEAHCRARRRPPHRSCMYPQRAFAACIRPRAL
jgi:NAD(P)-dependent dehydrogenase (short-subunit alcohol dehydrogenase family)